MNQSEDNKKIPMTSVSSGKMREVRDDICYYTNQIVNLVFIGKRREKNWILIDAGMPKSESEIIKVAEKRFGKNNRPSAIILTHGHFDHVGSIVGLIEKWNVPVYAHPIEFPYLTGREQYPEPDTSVEGGGLLSTVSFIYPVKPINIEGALSALPGDGSIPGMPGWRWIHTPGHSNGHVSFFREEDRFLLSGDAFITVRQDSLYRVLVQKKEINGPPKYFTTNWQAAWDSVKLLASLNPQAVITGHGTAMEGEELTAGLKRLAAEFDILAIPEYGKYVPEPTEIKP